VEAPCSPPGSLHERLDDCEMCFAPVSAAHAFELDDAAHASLDHLRGLADDLEMWAAARAMERARMRIDLRRGAHLDGVIRAGARLEGHELAAVAHELLELSLRLAPFAAFAHAIMVVCADGVRGFAMRQWMIVGVCSLGAFGCKPAQPDENVGSIDDEIKCVVEKTCQPKSCKVMKQAVPNAKTGTYLIDPDGNGPNAAFDVHCDMDQDGGGYTLLLHLKDPGQLTGAGREQFWSEGKNLVNWNVQPFVSMTKGDFGFVGWDRINPILGQTVQILVRGTNALGENIAGELYVAQTFGVDTGNGVIETGKFAGEGTWTASVWGDKNSRHDWGTCGVFESPNAHVGIGLCQGYSNLPPVGHVVQVWHNAGVHGDFTGCMNISFGNAFTASNQTSSCPNVPVEIELLVREAKP
jgi:hypothetical protein